MFLYYVWGKMMIWSFNHFFESYSLQDYMCSFFFAEWTVDIWFIVCIDSANEKSILFLFELNAILKLYSKAPVLSELRHFFSKQNSG